MKTKTDISKEELLRLYSIGILSRQLSLLGRKEVLTGKAKFGIFGDGKELVQLVMSHFFQKGDWRSGYYRDQTLMMALNLLSAEQFFAHLYGDTDVEYNPDNAGRLMNNHFATRSIDNDGNWLDLSNQYNVSPDISPTAGQMPRSLGLALASALYRLNPALIKEGMTIQGNEISLVTIGDASTSEGHFWETLNAAAVMKVPLAVVVYDDGYGISVKRDKQTVKDSISQALAGFKKEDDQKTGIEIICARGWNFYELWNAFKTGMELCRSQHIPVLFHITELTQPQGHSTSGSHERYKSKERLDWEKEFDAILQFKLYLIQQEGIKEDELMALENQAINIAKESKKKAWNHYIKPINALRQELTILADVKSCRCAKSPKIQGFIDEMNQLSEPTRRDVISTAKRALRHICNTCAPDKSLKRNLIPWIAKQENIGEQLYCSHLYSDSPRSSKRVVGIPPTYSDQSMMVPGREILRDNFDMLLQKYPEMLAFGEDVGGIGGVNQTWEGLQAKYGESRVFDTGIREATILGQAIGMALRGLRPIAEIQYFDYLMYALQTISDDLANLRWRTVGRQMAPVIVSTRGHRLEGVWHSGSALSMVINSVRGVNVIVPRNMTQAAGFYNTLLKSDDPAIIIEPLNAYRIREKKPENIGEFCFPLGHPEIIKEGKDLTLVTYGSCVRIAQEALPQLEEFGISVELIDVQTLLPFDLIGVISKSIEKTNKVVFFDEDVPGGATAFMMREVLENQGAWSFLDAQPKTLTAKENRPAYGTDGDYFSNPNAEDVFETIYGLMNEYNPNKYPKIY